MQRLRATLLVTMVGLIAANAAPARADGFENVVLSSTKGSDVPETTFARDTPKIFVRAQMTDAVKSGSEVVVSWIAVDTGGVAPPNYKIDEVSLNVILANVIDSALSKPDSGWPVGDYNVVFSIDGKVMETTDFKVK
ncbi:hypothetical protein QO004_003772 [Rhizobium mesoamericanum]|uniref:hypothetical protein n=1 Tax=Rhizobium mesoamericanum TaxID=1079800 RepID=UPI00278B8991|nr:hypothetical protein [Rhizobium mesoamericanum]MDQ0561971.1 hypothetical protein [Rhizobium mesoamericanum]